MGNKKGAYWFGSTLSIQEARSIAPYNNATSLQVVAGIISAMLWAIANPNQGVIEPEDIDHEYVMNIALPYLGKVSGHYTDWTPLQNRELGISTLDEQDPWQFINIRVE
jgi:homospermidine synthase